MKIAIVSPYPPSKGTLNEYGYHLINQFLDKEEVSSIHVLTDYLPNDEAYPSSASHNGKLEIIPCWRFNSLTTLFDLRRKIKELQPDIVLYNIQFLSFGDKKIAGGLGLLSPWLTKSRKTKSVVLLHNILEEVDLGKAGITSNKLLQFVFNTIGTVLTRILLKADLVGVTITKYVDTLRSKYGAKHVVLLPHGSFETPPEPDYNPPLEKYTLMTFGKFGTYKKVEHLIEATEQAKKKLNKPIKLVIAGSDSPNTPGYLDDIAKRFSDIKDLEFTGYVAEEDVPKIFTECHAVVFPYTSTTGSSGVLHQAGSYGKAVILPKIGDLERLIEEEGYEGVYFDPERTESLGEAVVKILEDQELRLQLAKKNYNAAAGLPLRDVANWYLMHFNQLQN